MHNCLQRTPNTRHAREPRAKPYNETAFIQKRGGAIMLHPIRSVALTSGAYVCGFRFRATKSTSGLARNIVMFAVGGNPHSLQDFVFITITKNTVALDST